MKGYIIESTWLDYGSVKAVEILKANNYKKLQVLNDVYCGADLFMSKLSSSGDKKAIIKYNLDE